MSVRSVQVTISGITPLLMHAYPMVPIEAMEKKTPAEQAEIAAYRNRKGELYIPGVNLQRCLVAAAAYQKGKGRATLQKPAAACLMVSPEGLTLGVEKYQVDSRPVVIPATKGRIMRHRPRLDSWAVSFTLEYDDVLLREDDVRRIVDDAGRRVGLLDFRPEHKGPFGRFVVNKWSAA